MQSQTELHPSKPIYFSGLIGKKLCWGLHESFMTDLLGDDFYLCWISYWITALSLATLKVEVEKWDVNIISKIFGIWQIGSQILPHSSCFPRKLLSYFPRNIRWIRFLGNWKHCSLGNWKSCSLPSLLQNPYSSYRDCHWDGCSRLNFCMLFSWICCPIWNCACLTHQSYGSFDRKLLLNRSGLLVLCFLAAFPK